MNQDLGSNLVDMFLRTAERKGDAPFLWAKIDGEYRPWSYARVLEEAKAIARFFQQMGLEKGDRVLLVAENRPEWCITDLGIMFAGGVTVPAYTTNTSDDHQYILSHSDSKFVVCSGKSLAKRLIPAIASVDHVKSLLFFDPLSDVGTLPVTAVSWADAIEMGQRADTPLPVAIEPDDLACFIYTSGTGGQPKGVMLSHKNVMANLRGAYVLLEEIGLGDEVFLSFLPLSHSYEHTGGQFFPIALGAEIYYAEGTETLSTNLVEARPTILTCVPRLYEVLRARIVRGVERQGGMKQKLFELAVSLGRKKYEQGGLSFPLNVVDRLLDKLVRVKVAERFGGRIKAMVSGGAPLNVDVGMFFLGLGLPVLQGYGQTEASPVISANVPGRTKIDTVGPPLDGVDVKIADDGEILVRGDLVMQGYWKDPEATAKTLVDGWLHTGDVGVMDADRYIKITDRKKDLIVNSGGDNVSPQRVEGFLLLQPEITQAVVYGDRKPYLVALIVVDPETLKKFGLEGASGEALSGHAELRNAVGEAVKKTNTNLSAIERVRKFHIMPEPFTVDNHMMTPTLKLRRGVINENYGELVESLYRAGS